MQEGKISPYTNPYGAAMTGAQNASTVLSPSGSYQIHCFPLGYMYMRQLLYTEYMKTDKQNL